MPSPCPLRALSLAVAEQSDGTFAERVAAVSAAESFACPVVAELRAENTRLRDAIRSCLEGRCTPGYATCRAAMKETP